MRLFIAFILPDNIKKELGKIEENFKEADIQAKWVKPDNLHITVKFLGEVEKSDLEAIQRTIAQTAGKFSSIKVNLNAFGFFPHEKRPRVFFVSTDEEKKLQNISEDLETNLEQLGFAKENRFKSHITLARIKDSKNTSGLLIKTKGLKARGEFIIEGLTLFESKLSPSGPTYKEIYRADFKP